MDYDETLSAIESLLGTQVYRCAEWTTRDGSGVACVFWSSEGAIRLVSRADTAALLAIATPAYPGGPIAWESVTLAELVERLRFLGLQINTEALNQLKLKGVE